MKDPLVYIEHIYEALIKIKEYTKGMALEDFLQNTLVQDAVIRNFEIIGEASKNVDESFRQKYLDIEWKKMAGMRDKLIHDYIGVDLWAVWGVVDKILPRLVEQFFSILKQENKL